MQYLARAAAIAVAATLAGGPVAGAAELPTGYTASYKVYTAGLYTLDFELAATIKAERFVARMSASPHGIIAKFIPWVLEASSAGVLAAGGLRPRRHRSANWWRGEQRWVEIDFDGEGPVDLRAKPASEASVFAVNPESGVEGGLLVFHPATFTDFSTGLTIIQRSARGPVASTYGPLARVRWRG